MTVKPIIAEPIVKANAQGDPAPQAAPSKTEAVQVDDAQDMLCTVCNWVYEPAIGEPNQDVAAGTAWNDVPDFFLCPECGLGKDVFVAVAQSKAS